MCKAGDVFKINTTRGVAIVQLVDEPMPRTPTLIRVMPGLYQHVPRDMAKFLEKKELYFARFSIEKYADSKDSPIESLAHFTLPKTVVRPTHMKIQKKDPFGLTRWEIVDLTTRRRETVTKLTDEEVKLSPWYIPTYPLFMFQITNEWDLNRWGTPDEPKPDFDATPSADLLPPQAFRTDEQAVIIQISLASLTNETVAQIRALEQELETTIKKKGIGEYDGDEIHKTNVLLYLYGKNAEEIFGTIEPILRNNSISQQAIVTIRKGTPGAPQRQIKLQ